MASKHLTHNDHLTIGDALRQGSGSKSCWIAKGDLSTAKFVRQIKARASSMKLTTKTRRVKIIDEEAFSAISNIEFADISAIPYSYLITMEVL